MSYETLVWLEPMAEAWFGCQIGVAVAFFLAALVYGISAGMDEDLKNVGFYRRRLRFIIAVIILALLNMVAVNPLTDGPALWKKTHGVVDLPAEKAE